MYLHIFFYCTKTKDEVVKMTFEWILDVFTTSLHPPKYCSFYLRPCPLSVTYFSKTIIRNNSFFVCLEWEILNLCTEMSILVLNWGINEKFNILNWSDWRSMSKIDVLGTKTCWIFKYFMWRISQLKHWSDYFRWLNFIFFCK